MKMMKLLLKYVYEILNASNIQLKNLDVVKVMQHYSVFEATTPQIGLMVIQAITEGKTTTTRDCA